MSDKPLPPFKPWLECVKALSDELLGSFAKWRALSWEFCLFLREQRLLGVYNGNFCFPIHGPGGAVIAEQVLTPNSSRGKNFCTAGAAGNLSPVVLGALPHAKLIFLGESPHDDFAVADRTELWRDPCACFVATRGASNEKLVAGLPWPKPNNGAGPEIFLLCQNDSKILRNGKTANQLWVEGVRALLPFSYYRWLPPKGSKDFNEATRAGISKKDLLGEIGQFRDFIEPEVPQREAGFVLSGRHLLNFLDLEIDPRTNLLGERWLTQDGSGFVIAPSGHGKSSFSIQAAICWSIGRVAFGIKPARPLRILIIQSEDDDAESKKFVQMIRKMKLSERELELLALNTRFEYRRDLSGDDFIRAVDAFLTEWPADILIINPLSGFLLCDLKDEQTVTQFLRAKLNALMAKHGCAPLVVHHTPKMNFVKLENMQWYDWMYAMSGCAALTNWGRAVLVIAPSKVPGTYRFIAAKRFDEIQWTEREYWFAHYKETLSSAGKEHTILQWVPASAEQIAGAKPTPKGQHQTVMSNLIFDKMSVLEWYTREEFKEWAGSEFGIGLNRASQILTLLRDKGLVEVSVEKRPKTNPIYRYRKISQPASTNDSRANADA